MSSDEEKFKINHAGLLARSTQGHAAQGMKIKDQQDMWVDIQHHTFKNWVNVQLRETGLKVEDLSEDLCSGVALVSLVEVLQKRRLRKIKKVLNQHQAYENVTTALNAIADDGIKLVNIGNEDIVNGNLKLILGLIWSLIMHYQIGQSKFPPKRLMLAWLKAVLPDLRVHNFTNDWNSGVYLSALLDYCKPGLFSNWKQLNPRNAVDNCKNAMEIAKKEFNIPMLLEPEILASPYLDDLSGMTYLSYFMKEGGPGYKATLDWIRTQLPDKNITNFTTDWNDGMNLTTLVKQLGGPVPGYKKLTPAQDKWESNLQLGIDGGKRLGVEPVMSAADMAHPDVEYLGNMGYIAYYQWIQARNCPSDTVAINCSLDNVRVNNPVPFDIEFLSKEVVLSEIKVEVVGPSGPVRVDLDLGPRGGNGVFIPEYVGMYELNVYNEEELVDGCPVKVRALPDVSKIMFSGIEPCAIGSIVEVVVNSNGAGATGIEVTAYSPTKRPLACPVKEEDGVYAAVFQPDEAGEWSIAVTYGDEHIQGSPFSCHVFDPNALKMLDLDKGPSSKPGVPFTFIVDASECGYGDAKVDITEGGRSVQHRSLEIERGVYEISFIPTEAAKHKVYAYFSGHEVKGSPFSLYLGIEKPPERKDSKAKKKKSVSRENKDPKEAREVVKEYTASQLINNSPRLSLSNLTSSSHNESLVNISDSTRKVSQSSSRMRTKLYDSKMDQSYENVEIIPDYENVSPPTLNKSRDSSFSKSSSTYENINSKYANFESSSMANRTSVLDSSTSKTSTYEMSPPPKPIFSSSPRKSIASDSSYSSPSKFDSFNTSTSTVINTAKSSTVYNRSSSPGRIYTTGLHKSASPSPPPPPVTEYEKRPISPPADLTGLSAPSKVLQISNQAKNCSEGSSFYYSSVANMKILPSTY